MGSVNVLRELEELRSMLDTPTKKPVTPGSRLDGTPPPMGAGGVSPSFGTSSVLRKDYGYALSSAERSVDRLGRAIEAAEDEMEAALKRTTEVHRSQLRQKEVELQELQRLMAAKERSVESLRETLATTKRSYEGRLSQSEAALSLKDAEISSLREELRVARTELESVQLGLRHDLTAQSREIQQLREQERELHASGRAQGEEVTRLTAQLRSEREGRRSAVHDAEEQRRQAELVTEELRVLRQSIGAEREAYRSEIADLKRRLKGERSIRKACEKWLRAELRSREEYDMLLRAIRESAHGSSGSDAGTGKSLPSGGVPLGSLSGPLEALVGGTREVQEVEVLLEKLKATAGLSSSPDRDDRFETAAGRRRGPAYGGYDSSPSAGGSPGGAGLTTSLVAEAELARRRMEEDNRRLQSELLAAKKLLQEQRVQRLL